MPNWRNCTHLSTTQYRMHSHAVDAIEWFYDRNWYICCEKITKLWSLIHIHTNNTHAFAQYCTTFTHNVLYTHRHIQHHTVHTHCFTKFMYTQRQKLAYLTCENAKLQAQHTILHTPFTRTLTHIKHHRQYLPTHSCTLNAHTQIYTHPKIICALSVTRYGLTRCA